LKAKELEARKWMQHLHLMHLQQKMMIYHSRNIIC
jgi:hypothetical protein